jgi:hypothetical protein
VFELLRLLRQRTAIVRGRQGKRRRQRAMKVHRLIHRQRKGWRLTFSFVSLAQRSNPTTTDSSAILRNCISKTHVTNHRRILPAPRPEPPPLSPPRGRTHRPSSRIQPDVPAPSNLQQILPNPFARTPHFTAWSAQRGPSRWSPIAILSNLIQPYLAMCDRPRHSTMVSRSPVPGMLPLRHPGAL